MAEVNQITLSSDELGAATVHLTDAAASLRARAATLSEPIPVGAFGEIGGDLAAATNAVCGALGACVDSLAAEAAAAAANAASAVQEFSRVDAAAARAIRALGSQR